MRTGAAWALAATVLVAAAPPPRAGEAPAALLDRAIKAHGGEAALTKALVCSRSETGAQGRPGKELTFTREVVRSLPGRVRWTTGVQKRLTIIVVLNGDKGWERVGGPPVGLNKQRLEELREEAHVAWVATLVPLKKAGFTLSALPEAKVDGQAVVGLKVARPGHADCNVFFFKSTGLLAKISRRVSRAGAPADEEHSYSDYKAFGGAKLPTKERLTINGQRIRELTVTGYKFLPRVPAGQFGRP
jgi:hypothetical protein